MDNSAKKLSQEEQIAKIQEIMGDKEDVIPYFTFKWGKYQGKTLDYVLTNDKQYLLWLYNNSEKLPKKLEKFIEDVVLRGYQ